MQINTHQYMQMYYQLLEMYYQRVRKVNVCPVPPMLNIKSKCYEDGAKCWMINISNRHFNPD